MHSGSPLVLIADDNLETCDLYASFLSAAGYRVETAVDGYEAFLKAQALQPRIIVMDLHMPRIDGFRALDKLRKDPKTKAIPVIVLTGHDFKSLMKPAALALGANSYLTKPCRPDELAIEIDERLRVSWTGPLRAGEM